MQATPRLALRWVCGGEPLQGTQEPGIVCTSLGPGSQLMQPSTVLVFLVSCSLSESGRDTQTSKAASWASLALNFY